MAQGVEDSTLYPGIVLALHPEVCMEYNMVVLKINFTRLARKIDPIRQINCLKYKMSYSLNQQGSDLSAVIV